MVTDRVYKLTADTENIRGNISHVIYVVFLPLLAVRSFLLRGKLAASTSSPFFICRENFAASLSASTLFIFRGGNIPAMPSLFFPFSTSPRSSLSSAKEELCRGRRQFLSVLELFSELLLAKDSLK